VGHKGEIVTSNSNDYERQAAKLLPCFQLTAQQRFPFLILLPRTTADVQRSVVFCRDFENENKSLPKTVFQFGWSPLPLLRPDATGDSSTAVVRRRDSCVVDLREMRSVIVDRETKTCWAEAGATIKDLDLAAEAFGLCTASGPSSRISVHHAVVSGDCFGPQTSRFGLLMDSVIAAEVVMNTGEIKVCSLAEDPELLWIIKGSASVPGCVTRLKFQLFDRPCRTVYRATMPFPLRLVESIVQACETHLGPDFTYSLAIVTHPYVVGVTVCSVQAVFTCSLERARDLFRSLSDAIGEGPINGDDPDVVMHECILPKASWWQDEIIPPDVFICAESFRLPDADYGNAVAFLTKAIANKPTSVIVTLDHVHGEAFLKPKGDSIWQKRQSFFSAKLLYPFTNAKMQSGDAQGELSTFRSYCRSVQEHTHDIRAPSLSCGIRHSAKALSRYYGAGMGEKVEKIEQRYDSDRFFTS